MVKMKRGRPKGRSRDSRSFGPLGDLIRKHRMERGLGLLDVARACDCSVQFISNIEHGRAPLPWEKVEQLSSFLKIAVEELQAANLAIRSDFKSFVQVTKGGKGKKVPAPAVITGLSKAASAVAFTANDQQLRDILQKYSAASPASKKKFVKAALRSLSN
ncbi:helix-turn-helix domain-containing protein [bacterium]|jgi:transcriptional regulator with XRE-family HTH domain|nr:helix-turn-helix domain-containing protein [bacterium]